MRIYILMKFASKFIKKICAQAHGGYAFLIVRFTLIVCEKKQKVLLLIKLSTGTCFTPNITDASVISSYKIKC